MNQNDEQKIEIKLKNFNNWTTIFKKLSEQSELIKKCYLKLAGMDWLTEITIPSTEKYAENIVMWIMII
jgi:hypothetical protein